MVGGCLKNMFQWMILIISFIAVMALFVDVVLAFFVGFMAVRPVFMLFGLVS